MSRAKAKAHIVPTSSDVDAIAEGLRSIARSVKRQAKKFEPQPKLGEPGYPPPERDMAFLSMFAPATHTNVNVPAPRSKWHERFCDAWRYHARGPAANTLEDADGTLVVAPPGLYGLVLLYVPRAWRRLAAR